jgi:hypothetical protein
MCCCTVLQCVPLALDQIASRDDGHCVVCRCRMESCLEVSCAELVDCCDGEEIFEAADPDTSTIARCAVEGRRARASSDEVVNGIDSLLARLIIGSEPAYPKEVVSSLLPVYLPRNRYRSACQSCSVRSTCSRACVEMDHPANKKQLIEHARHHRDNA